MKWLNAHKKEIILATLILVFIFSIPTLLRWFDPTAGVLDPSAVQLLGLGALKYILAIMLGWGSGMRLLFPSLAKYGESGGLRTDFTNRVDGTLPYVALTLGCSLACFALALWALNSSF